MSRARRSAKSAHGLGRRAAPALGFLDGGGTAAEGAGPRGTGGRAGPPQAPASPKSCGSLKSRGCPCICAVGDTPVDQMSAARWMNAAA